MQTVSLIVLTMRQKHSRGFCCWMKPYQIMLRHVSYKAYRTGDPQVLHWTQISHALLGAFKALPKKKRKEKHDKPLIKVFSPCGHLKLLAKHKDVTARRKKVELMVQITESDMLRCVL